METIDHCAVALQMREIEWRVTAVTVDLIDLHGKVNLDIKAVLSIQDAS